MERSPRDSDIDAVCDTLAKLFDAGEKDALLATVRDEHGEVVTAPAPVKVIAKGLPGPELLAQVMLAKFRDHCPLTRQVALYRRLGVTLSRNTLVGSVAAVADLLQPIARLIRARVSRAYVLQADDTRLPVLDRRKAQNIKRGHLWALVGDPPYVAYEYTDNWRGETVRQLLGERAGWLQVDGYVGYQSVFAQGHATEVGCMMHARRYSADERDHGSPPSNSRTTSARIACESFR